VKHVRRTAVKRPVVRRHDEDVARRQAALLRLTAGIAAATDEADVYRSMVEGLHDEALGYNFLGAFLLEPETGDRVLQASVGWPDVPHRFRVHPGQGLSERVLEDGRFEPVGSVTTQQVDVRIIAATNRTLDEAVAAKQFREDLFYRLRVVPIEMPPLRRRAEDIALLVGGVLAQLAQKGLPRFEVTPAAIAVLERYSWPGNVRELRNLLEQLVVLGRPEHLIDVHDLPPHVVAAHEAGEASPAMPWQFGAAGIDFYREMEAIEDRIIAQALRLSGGNKKEAARLLRVNRTTLLEKLKRKRAQGGALAALLGAPLATGCDAAVA